MDDALSFELVFKFSASARQVLFHAVARRLAVGADDVGLSELLHGLRAVDDPLLESVLEAHEKAEPTDVSQLGPDLDSSALSERHSHASVEPLHLLAVLLESWPDASAQLAAPSACDPAELLARVRTLLDES